MTPLRHRWSLAQLRRAEIIGVVAVVALGGATAAWRLTSGDAANPDWVVTTGVTTATPTTIGVVSHPPVPHTPSGTDAVEVESEAPVPASAGNGEAVDPSGTDAPTSSVSGASVPITRAPRGTTPSTTVAGEVSDVPFDLPTSDADSSSTSSTPTTEPDARTGTPPVPATTVAGTTPVTATPRTTTTTTPPTTAAPTTTRPPATTTTTTVPTTTTTVPTTTTTTTTTTEPTTTTDSSTTTTDSSTTTTTDPSPNS